MILEINTAMMDGFVREWLKDALKTLQMNVAREYVHPEDKETYEKDIEAVKRLLDYIGEPV